MDWDFKNWDCGIVVNSVMESGSGTLLRRDFVLTKYNDIPQDAEHLINTLER